MIDSTTRSLCSSLKPRKYLLFPPWLVQVARCRIHRFLASVGIVKSSCRLVCYLPNGARSANQHQQSHPPNFEWNRPIATASASHRSSAPRLTASVTCLSFLVVMVILVLESVMCLAEDGPRR
jgi:hypothetical protein